MPVQRSQARLRPLVPRPDELPDGVPAPSAADVPVPPAIERQANGAPVPGDAAAALGRLGGLAAADAKRRTAETPKLAQGLGLRDVSVPELLPYLNDAAELAEHECARLGQVVGGGTCGTAPSVIVASAALQIAGSRYAFAKGDVLTGSRLADAARANLLSAHELAAREAEARRNSESGGAAPWLEPAKEDRSGS